MYIQGLTFLVAGSPLAGAAAAEGAASPLAAGEDEDEGPASLPLGGRLAGLVMPATNRVA